MQVKIYQFPTREDFQQVQAAVRAFLTVQSGITRRLMVWTLHKILKQYRISKLHLPNFTVERKKGGGAVVRARCYIEENYCPTCGAPVYVANGRVRILSIKEAPRIHAVTYGCKCGTVFGKLEPVH